MSDEDQGLGRESRQEWTPLHFAADEQDAAAVGSLQAAGAWVDAPDGQGNTPLWHAVFTYRGDGAVLSLLVDAGADSDRDNLHGVSPRRLADWRVGSDGAAHLGERPAS
ncbi:ankyrin repeat domain-containing protein [Streptomyces sp. CoH27]|uniref:ankyrin repeat domain-containing protein n=1 Tax=Streptomyces sp. CoH27 TaxID=2875763 RepID=UPI001CD3E9E7|nr:ankyrin repeat domain-containing protein [Streptomyces sp. CoH27]